MGIIIIGVDCATEQKKIGLACSSISKGKMIIAEVAVGSRIMPAAEMIQKWLQKDQPALLALDAPLGWPTALGQELCGHFAGMPLESTPDYFFSRETDRSIQDRIGKRPLEVGANLIARTAHSALNLLQDLRKKTGLSIPLAWDIGDIRQTCAIEVYPAATLAMLEIKAGDYKKKDAQDRRLELIDNLQKHVQIPISQRRLLKESSDAIDAVVCALGGYDFILGKCQLPYDMETARKEGWIWVRSAEA